MINLLPTTFLEVYPETDLMNRWETHCESVISLSPLPDTDPPGYSEAFAKAARDEARRTGENPIMGYFGTNFCDTIFRGRVAPELVLMKPDPINIPPINELPCPTRIRFHERLNPSGNTFIYKIFLGDNTETPYFLKIFADDVPDLDKLTKDERWALWDHEKGCISSQGFSRRRFNRETTAYARLEYHGVGAAGIVPKCYGWFTVDLSSGDLPLEVLKDSKRHENPPRALLLEFIPDVERVTPSSATALVAKAAMEALQAVHRAFVLHNDIHSRNVLLNRNTGRVYLVDFDSAYITSGDDSLPHRGTLLNELGEMWLLFFAKLIPNSFIGWDGSVPTPPKGDGITLPT